MTYLHGNKLLLQGPARRKGRSHIYLAPLRPPFQEKPAFHINKTWSSWSKETFFSFLCRIIHIHCSSAEPCGGKWNFLLCVVHQVLLDQVLLFQKCLLPERCHYSLMSHEDSKLVSREGLGMKNNNISGKNLVRIISNSWTNLSGIFHQISRNL